MIPRQLQSDDIRFVKVKPMEKRPYEKSWTTAANYSYHDPSLTQHLEGGGNYGVVCGGKVCVLDYDEEELTKKLNGSLPETFRVKTGGGGFHDYFLCDNMPKMVLEDEGKHLGELQGTGSQVIGPNSTHPNGNKYEVVRDVPLTRVTRQQLEDALRPFAKAKGEAVLPSVYSTLSINVAEVVSKSANLRKRGDEYQGEHPVHGSDTGMNFCINPGKNVWHCFRCNTGGSVFELIAVQEGLIECSKVGRGCLTGDIFKKVIQIAKERYNYKDAADLVSDKARAGLQLSQSDYAAMFLADRGADARYQLARNLVATRYIVTHQDSDVVLAFNGKNYDAGGGVVVRQEVQSSFAEHASNYQAGEVLGHVKRSTYTPEDDFDKPKNWVCLQNGVLDVLTGDFVPHTPKFLTRSSLPVFYDPNADFPLIQAFLSEILDPKDIPLIQELAGYCLWKEYPLQKAFMFLGEGANGKSTLLGIFEAFLGRENISTVSLQDLAENKFAAAQLVNKMANIYPDLPSKALKHTGMFKVLTGGDSVMVERKFKDGFTYRNHAKLVFSCNKLPEAQDDTDAFYRRWLFVNFPNQFTGEKADKNKLKKLTTQEELSGFLNWALEGLKRLREKQCFTDEGSTEEMRKVYIKMSSPIGAFVDEWLVFDPLAYITKEDMYEGLVTYCKENQLSVPSKDMLSKRIAEYAPKIRDARVGGRGNQQRAWMGYRGVVDAVKSYQQVESEDLDITQKDMMS